MKTNQLVFLFAFVLSVPVSWQYSASAAEGILPKISFEKTVCDLGDVGQGTKNTCESKFTNTGQGLLKIGKISRTCGCVNYAGTFDVRIVCHRFFRSFQCHPCHCERTFASGRHYMEFDGLFALVGYFCISSLVY